MAVDTIEEFIKYIQEVRNYSVHTIVSYKCDIKQYRAFAASLELYDISHSSHMHARSWIVTLVEQGNSTKTINRKVASLRKYFNYLKRLGIIDKSPMGKVLAPKNSKRLPKYVDEKKIREILNDNCLEKTFSSKREHLILSLFYHTGIRRSELLGLKLQDIDLSKMQIKVLGKGNKERLIPLNDVIAIELREFIAIRNEVFGESETSLILTDKGKPAYPKLIYNIVSKVLKKYNASEKASPHVLRHTFATHLTANGADLNAVKELLGHSSLAATQVYTHNSIERLKEVYDKSHPKSKN